MKKKQVDAIPDAARDLLDLHGGRRFSTILADPPWRFQNRTGKMAPEHKRLSRYGTMTIEDIMALPVEQLADDPSHLIWMPPFEQVDIRCMTVRSKCCLISGLLCRRFLLALMKSAERDLIFIASFFGTSLIQALPSPV
ncbi:hypothetical protein ACSSZE_18790 [Acidithiobacillus caldus]